MMDGSVLNGPYSFSPGTSGSEPTVYSSVGELVSLPFTYHGSFNSSSTTWAGRNGQSRCYIELVIHGKVRDENQEKSGKLRVGPNCSLHINNFKMGSFPTKIIICVNQLHNSIFGSRHVTISHVSFSVSASSPLTELKIGSTVTLLCKLHSSEPCGKSIRVIWVSETGAPLQGNRYKLSESECSSSLTVIFERSDRNMKWRCQLTEDGKLKASHSYTTIFPGKSWLSF
ncbi:uncharacterized protein LOC118207870 [Anguilla anguilla]|uniref:uncharacterized protein LOC118207870 n=1 Tax=Anguilla anguilla TaxID=7936 RepID=UPI0015AF1F2A|nr:uncharacterized protein LOC118207870 [Anguilla anguilla]